MASNDIKSKSFQDVRKEFKTYVLATELPAKEIKAKVLDITEGVDKRGRKAVYITYETEFGKTKMKYLQTHVNALIDFLTPLGINSFGELIGKTVTLKQYTFGNSTRHYIIAVEK